MGRRGRGKGITGAMTRAARAASMARDEEAQAIAQNVYRVAQEVKLEAGFPLSTAAPLQAAAELAAARIVQAFGLKMTPENVYEVAAYLMSGFYSMVAEFNVEHFTAWSERAQARGGGRDGGSDSGGASAGASVHDGSGGGQPGSSAESRDNEGADPWGDESAPGVRGAGRADGDDL